jgi:hypothetical protein
MIEERRRYFRIDDSMGISYELLGNEEAKVFARQSNEHGGNFDYASHFDNRIQTLLESCKLQTPIAAELLDLLNKKLNFVIQQMDVDAELMHKVAYTLRQVNVSACGIAFANEEMLNQGQLLKLDIMLQPTELHVVAMAEVVDCTAITSEEIDGGNHCFVRLNFTEINTNDQELLIQHMVKKQSEQLKIRRQQRN